MCIRDRETSDDYSQTLQNAGGDTQNSTGSYHEWSQEYGLQDVNNTLRIYGESPIKKKTDAHINDKLSRLNQKMRTTLGVGSSERIDDSEGFVNALKERYNAVFGFSEGAWCCLGHLVSCRAILDHEGPISCYFRPIRHPCGPLKRPQSGPIWRIIMYYAPENCFRATWGHACLLYTSDAADE